MFHKKCVAQKKLPTINFPKASYLVNKKSVIVVDRREHQNSFNSFGLYPPSLHIPRNMINEQGISKTDVLPLKIHVS